MSLSSRHDPNPQSARPRPSGSRGLSARREDDRLVIQVSDTGIGILPEDQARIFDRFFRSASATSLAVPGAGLGLSITRMIVEEHGGSIAVSSQPDEGTRMTVCLPLHRVESRPPVRPALRGLA